MSRKKGGRSLKEGQGSGLAALSDSEDNKISFRFDKIDESQGQTIQEWIGIIDGTGQSLFDEMWIKLKEWSTMTFQELTSGRGPSVYPEFPSHSEFSKPANIPFGVKWVALKVKGLVRVIGYRERHVIHIVFLDRLHKFYPTSR